MWLPTHVGIWGVGGARNHVFGVVFCSETQKVTVEFRIFWVGQHWTVRQWCANPGQVAVAEVWLPGEGLQWQLCSEARGGVASVIRQKSLQTL